MSPELRQFLELVNYNYKTHHHAAFYAGRLGLSSTSLNRLCRDELGLNVREVIAGKIIERAKALLPTQSTGEVADALGFASSSGLSGYFRRNAGLSIAQYKKRVLH